MSGAREASSATPSGRLVIASRDSVKQGQRTDAERLVMDRPAFESGEAIG
jgi:phosphate starvation-inducible protein PhoH